MAELLLVNPRRRAKKARRATAKRARRRNPVKVLRKVPSIAAARASNPRRRRARRRNPTSFTSRFARHRYRNPIKLGGVSVSSFTTMIKDAAVGGAGAIGMDMLWSRVNPYLPAVMRSAPGAVGVGTLVKAFATALLGQALARPTRGLSRKAASGSLAVQARDALLTVMPASMGLGYASPASITQGTQRVGPIRPGMNAYTRPGVTPLLNAYIKPGATPLLNRYQPARDRERAVR